MFPPSGPLATEFPVDCNRLFASSQTDFSTGYKEVILAKNQRQTCISLFVPIINLQNQSYSNGRLYCYFVHKMRIWAKVKTSKNKMRIF